MVTDVFNCCEINQDINFNRYKTFLDLKNQKEKSKTSQHELSLIRSTFMFVGHANAYKSIRPNLPITK